MNICDTKPITCKDCGKVVGEVDYDAEIIFPRCTQYANPAPHVRDKMSYLINH